MMISGNLVVLTGAEAVQPWWLEEKVEGWKTLVAIMNGVNSKHPLTAYAVLQKFFQQEWDFLQCVTPDIGTEFHTISSTFCHLENILFFVSSWVVSIAKGQHFGFAIINGNLWL